VTKGPRTPPERHLPIGQMSGAELSRYRRALVRYLKRCPEDDHRYGEMRTNLAGAMAEEQVRRLTDNASRITPAVPRIRL